jgi:6-pyruvoyltetrahydropterin/6-carboxytetrahydropterin synthase
MYEVTVSGWFAAAHRLRLADGRLEPLHGHNWQVRVTYAGARPDAQGLLMDFTDLKPRLARVLAEMHDRCLNELSAFADRNPTAEHVAAHIAAALQAAERSNPSPASGAAATAGTRVVCVEVEEEPGCFARYRPD